MGRRVGPCSALQSPRWQGADSAGFSPHPPSALSFEAWAKGGWGGVRGGVEASQPTSECPFLLGWLPALAWPTGPHKALPVSLAAPPPHPHASLPLGR